MARFANLPIESEAAPATLAAFAGLAVESEAAPATLAAFAGFTIEYEFAPIPAGTHADTFVNHDGTTRETWQIGVSAAIPASFVNFAGALEARLVSGALTVVRGAAPIGSDDFVTLATVAGSPYTPGNAAAWGSIVPVTIQKALDLIANNLAPVTP